MAQTEKKPGLIDRLGCPQVRLGGFFAILRALGETSKKEGPKAYQGILEEIFESQIIIADTEYILKENRFRAIVSTFRNSDPGQEFFRMLFIEPETGQQVIMDLSPSELQILRVEDKGGQVPKETPIFSRRIYGDRSLGRLRDKVLMKHAKTEWSIRKAKTSPDWAILPVLRELVPNLAPKSTDRQPIRLEPKFLAGQELARIIGENLGVFTSEQPR